MALMRLVLLVALAIAFQPRALDAQTPTLISELDVTVGHATEGVDAAGAQVRLFGEAPKEWRFFAEVSWADVWGPKSDAFGSAYPYNHRLRPVEVYVEKTARPSGFLTGVRAGRYRTPFGLYSRSDHRYAGFLRAPLIRYGGYWAVSNNFIEGGVSAIAGIPALHAEVSLGVPQDEDQYTPPRRPRSRRAAAGDGRSADRRRQLHPHTATGDLVVRKGPHGIPRSRRPMDARRRAGTR